MLTRNGGFAGGEAGWTRLVVEFKEKFSTDEFILFLGKIRPS